MNWKFDFSPETRDIFAVGGVAMSWRWIDVRRLPLFDNSQMSGRRLLAALAEFAENKPRCATTSTCYLLHLFFFHLFYIMTRMEYTRQGSKLLQLPAELRIAIFEYVFADDRDPIAIGLPSAIPWKGRPERYHPPLSEVCSTIRKEALPLSYDNKSVILLLRFREGRAQVQHWIKHVFSQPAICSKMREVRIQYFQECHRSTVVDIQMRDFVLLNQDAWLHPLTGRPLRVIKDVENALAEVRILQNPSTTDRASALQRVITAMLAPLQRSRLIRQESLASLRLNGYSDFELRFEVISMISIS